MRRRLIFTLAALSLIAVDASAQRVIRIGGSSGARPDRPAEKPRMAPGIHDNRFFLQSYEFSRLSIEEYPMLSYFENVGMYGEGIRTNYVGFGDGTHLEYRAVPSLALTTDFTSTFLGGPFAMSTAELGARIKPWVSSRFMPYVDARMGWSFTNGTGGPGGGFPFVLVYHAMSRDDAFTSGTGRGAALGLGVETVVNDRFSLTTTLTHARFDMNGRNVDFERFDYRSQATRLTVGFRYKHGRWIQAPRP